jgi:hypothetical protein
MPIHKGGKTMENKTYNGWTNRATWLVNLWVGNNLSDYAKDALDKNMTAADAEQYLKEDHWLEHVAEFGFISDLVNEVLGQVNWQEIANAANE